MSENGLAIRGAAEYVGWVGDTVKNRHSHAIWTRRNMVKEEGGKCGCDVLH